MSTPSAARTSSKPCGPTASGAWPASRRAHWRRTPPREAGWLTTSCNRSSSGPSARQCTPTCTAWRRCSQPPTWGGRCCVLRACVRPPMSPTTSWDSGTCPTCTPRVWTWPTRSSGRPPTMLWSDVRPRLQLRPSRRASFTSSSQKACAGTTMRRREAHAGPATIPSGVVLRADEEQRWYMSDKTTHGDGHQDLGDFGPDRIRNVVLIGPSSSGKTTLVETLLSVGGAVPRAGTVADGTTVCDHDEAEHVHGRSISLSVAPVVHNGTKINLIDTPGYADFVGELRAGLRAADCALFVVAANEDIDRTTTALWRECADVGMPRVVAITKLDHARADFDDVLAQAQAEFGEKVLPLFLPVHEGDQLAGLVGLLTEQFYDHRGDAVARVPLQDSPAAQQATADEARRGTLIEGIIEESEDEG